MRGPAKLATYVAVGMTAVGFVMIGMAWNFAAQLDFIQGQFPYVLSGGLPGLALIIGGMAILVIQAQRELMAGQTSQLERANAGMARVVALLRNPELAPTESQAGPQVIAGRSSYHDPGCHLVAGRDDLPRTTLEAARDQGLAPCQVCKPQ